MAKGSANMTWKRHRKAEGSTRMGRGSVKFYVLAGAIITLAATVAMADEAIAPGDARESTETDFCRSFGPGYFRLAGTQTCMKIGGSVRFDAGGGDLSGDRAPSRD